MFFIKSVMRILITILTSSDIDILEECVKSITNQTYPDYMQSTVQYDIVIMVNSTIPSYFQNVTDRFLSKDKIKVVSSVSNGKPGKGHNSVINYFRSHLEYDWMLPVDGDDVLYPTALWQVAKLLTTNNSFDMLVYLGLDAVTWDVSLGMIAITNGTFLKTTYDERNTLKTEHIYNPYSQDIMVHNCMCPVKTCMLNRRAASLTDPLIFWNEEATILEDYPPFLAALENHLSGNLRLAGTSNRYICIYNKLTKSNITTLFSNDIVPDESRRNVANEIFKSSISPFKRVQKDWNEIRNIPFIRTSDDVEFHKTIPNKIIFVQNTLVTHYFKRQLRRMEELFAKQQWAQFIDECQILFKIFPKLISKPLIANLRLNLGVCYCYLENMREALRQWNIALQISENVEQIATINSNIQRCQNLAVRTLG